MRRFAVSGLFFFAVLCASFAHSATPDLPQPSERVIKFLTPEAVALIKQADSVACWRIKPIEDRKAEKSIVGYPILSAGKVQDSAFAQKLARLLLSESSYQFDVAKACEFSPGVAFRLQKGDRYVDVLVCFSCDEWMINGHDGKPARAVEDMDPVRSELLKLAAIAFPDDEAIKGLVEEARRVGGPGKSSPNSAK